MATAFRQDTGELLGYLTEPEGPFPGGITYWPFKAWVHSDAKLRSEPEPGTDETMPGVTVDVPVRNNESADRAANAELYKNMGRLKEIPKGVSRLS